ncbi:MAG: DUF4345 family protein [Flavobacterium sp.]|nr:DUF4345 family protein [Pedobacter sp.]
MKLTSNFFFYTYTGLIVLREFGGAFINPDFNFRFLFGMEVSALPDSNRINLISHYHFLRALELGFGIFTLIFQKEIFSDHKFNSLFLFILASLILGRMVSLVADGIPNGLTPFFIAYEFIGLIIIYMYTKRHIGFYTMAS